MSFLSISTPDILRPLPLSFLHLLYNTQHCILWCRYPVGFYKVQSQCMRHPCILISLFEYTECITIHEPSQLCNLLYLIKVIPSCFFATALFSAAFGAIIASAFSILFIFTTSPYQSRGITPTVLLRDLPAALAFSAATSRSKYSIISTILYSCALSILRLPI